MKTFFLLYFCGHYALTGKNTLHCMLGYNSGDPQLEMQVKSLQQYEMSYDFPKTDFTLKHKKQETINLKFKNSAYTFFNKILHIV